MHKTRDELIQDAVRERLDSQYKVDKVNQLKQEIESKNKELLKLQDSLSRDSMYMPKWERQLKEDIDSAFEKYISNQGQPFEEHSI